MPAASSSCLSRIRPGAGLLAGLAAAALLAGVFSRPARAYTPGSGSLYTANFEAETSIHRDSPEIGPRVEIQAERNRFLAADVEDGPLDDSSNDPMKMNTVRCTDLAFPNATQVHIIGGDSEPVCHDEPLSRKDKRVHGAHERIALGIDRRNEVAGTIRIHENGRSLAPVPYAAVAEM